ncbi:hypothetical protein G9A89_010774 [Geosiphon pyriformis]|nr:hypothetical protein G9A89_010774 [Geosiphon pyriformis]
MPKNVNQKQAAIFLETKKTLCQYKLEHPDYSKNRLIKIFNLKVDCSTVTKILIKSDQWIEKNVFGNSGQLTKNKKEMFLKINDVLKEWMLGALATNCILTGKILQMKVFKFAEKFLEENNFKASDSWLEKFKKHHNLHHIKIHSKANSVPLEILPEK